MSQSILLVAAALILGVMGLSRHRAQVRDDRTTVMREMESGALVVAERWAGRARTLAFDEADVNAQEARVRNDVTGLSALLGLDSGEDAADPLTFDDADDYAGFAVQDTVTLATGDAALFDVQIDATYADRSTWAPQTSRTTAKILTVTATEANPTPNRLPATVTIPVRLTPAQQFLYR